MRQLCWLTLLLFCVQSCHKAGKNESSSSNSLPETTSPKSSLAQADSLFIIGEKFSGPNQQDSALHYHLASYKIKLALKAEDQSVLSSCLAIGKIYQHLNKFETAYQYYQKAKQIAEQGNSPNDLLFDLYSKLNTCSREMKDFPDALSFGKKMLRLAKQHESKKELSLAYDRLATVDYGQENYRKAIDSWNNAIRFANANDHQALGRLYYNIASAYKRNQEGKKALEFMYKSLSHDMSWAGPKSSQAANRYLSIAVYKADLNEFDTALKLFYKVLAIRLEVSGPKSIDAFGAHYCLGDFFYKMGRYDSSLKHHHESLKSFVKKFNDNDWHQNPKPAFDELNNDLVLGLVSKANALKALYNQDTSKTELLDLSLQTDLLADSVFQQYKNKLPFDDALLSQMSNPYLSYSNIIDKAFQLYQVTGNQKYFSDAFNTVEHTRAVTLQNSLQRALASNSSILPSKSHAEEKQVITERVAILQQLSKETLDVGKRDSLNDSLLEVTDRYESLMEEIRINNPSYFATRFENKKIDVTELQKKMQQSNSVLVEYFWGANKIYALAIGSDQVRFRSIALTHELMSAIETYKRECLLDPENALEAERFKKFCANSSTIYRYLIKDIVEKIKPDSRLIISADESLANIPFEALIASDPNSTEVDYRLPYLIKKFPVSYAFSGSVLLRQMHHQRDGKKLLAMGYAGKGSERVNRDGYTNLPGTEKEIMAIKDVMKNNINHYYTEAGTTETNFKKFAKDYDVVHLAIHGQGDTINSINSKLIFRTEQGSKEDGQLYAHELYTLDLDHLDLAVLSACESGIGKQQKGEGVMSIARGFAYAGCPSLVISLWKIDDHTTAQLMSKFYQYLSAGTALDISLTNAKLDYIKGANEFNSHPFYWAAFLQVGNSEKLDVKKPNWLGWALAVSVFLIVAIGLLFRVARPNY